MSKMEDTTKETKNLGIDFTVEPVPCSTMPLKYDDSLCIGCNRCASVFQCDILLPSP